MLIIKWRDLDVYTKETLIIGLMGGIVVAVLSLILVLASDRDEARYAHACNWISIWPEEIAKTFGPEAPNVERYCNDSKGRNQ